MGSAYPLTFTLSVAETSDGGSTSMVLDVATSGGTTPSNTYTYSGTSNSIIQAASSQPAEVSQPFIYGWHFNSVATSFTIPQYTTAFDLTYSSPSAVNPQYNGQSPTTASGTLTGSLTSNSYTIYPVGDPPDVSNSASTYTFSYYLSSQYQISGASATQTSAPTYTYVQVSGTTNQASASFNFGGTTPSGAVFIPYETSTNSLSTTASNIVFTPTITIQNPYSSYTQNQLVASLTGSSTGSSTTSNTASPSFTGNVYSTTSPATPSWTVNLNLYGKHIINCQNITPTSSIKVRIVVNFVVPICIIFIH